MVWAQMIKLDQQTHILEKRGLGAQTWCEVESTYSGSWQHNVPHGQDRYQYGNGDVYEGEYVDDLKHGIGKFSWSHGDWKIHRRPRPCRLPSRRRNRPKTTPSEHQMENNIYLRSFYLRLLAVTKTIETLPNNYENCVQWNECTIDLSWVASSTSTAGPRRTIFDTEIYDQCFKEDMFILELTSFSFSNPGTSSLREYCLSSVCQQWLSCRSVRNNTSVEKLLYR